MKIAIASGKGGTGKTTVAANLALALERQGSVVLADCDVEEPNCNLFLQMEYSREEPGVLPSFSCDISRCDGCGACARACRFNAIASLPNRPLFFLEMCHACGGCVLACPHQAIIESTRNNGVIRHASRGNLAFVSGLLDVGEAMATPLIRQMKKSLPQGDMVLLDAPPGAACAMIEAVRDVDYVVLVSEPTPFGLHDLIIAMDAVEELQLPFGVVINRYGSGDDALEEYCLSRGVPVIAKIPYSRKIAEAYSRGELFYNLFPELGEIVDDLAGYLREGGWKE